MPIRTAHKPHGLHFMSFLYVEPGVHGFFNLYLLRWFYKGFRTQTLGQGLAVGKNVVSNVIYNNFQYRNDITSFQTLKRQSMWLSLWSKADLVWWEKTCY